MLLFSFLPQAKAIAPDNYRGSGLYLMYNHSMNFCRRIYIIKWPHYQIFKSKTMCRYAFHYYKSTYVCLDCRKGFKVRNTEDLEAKDRRENHLVLCPQCRKEMTFVGKDYRVPKQQDKKAWKILKALIDQNFMFGTCGCSGIGFVPKNSAQLKALKRRYIKPETTGSRMIL